MKRSVLIALAAFALAGCAKESVVDSALTNAGNAIGFNTYSNITRGNPFDNNPEFAASGNVFGVTAFISTSDSPYMGKADAGTDKVFNAEIIDVMRAGLKLRLQENGAVVFMPARHILDNKDRLECNWDNGRVYLDKTEVVYELGQIIEVKLTEAVEETRSLIAKPAVDLVPGPAPVAPASEAEAAPADEAPKAQ